MGDVSDKLGRLAQTKADIRAALEEKGMTVEDEDPFAMYADKIRDIPVRGAPDPNGALDPIEVYRTTRPPDWLPMPEPQDGEIYLLIHIPDKASSLLAFTATCTGNYTVEMGTVVDGKFVQRSTITLPSGTKYDEELIADDYGDLTGDGYKQAVMKVSGSDLTSWGPETHTKKKKPAGFVGWNIVEMSGRGEAIEHLTCDGLSQLRYFALYGENGITSMEAMFRNCKSLIAVLCMQTQNVTTVKNAFYYCEALVAIPGLDLGKTKTMDSVFYLCTALRAIPELNTGNVEIMDRAFYGCTVLRSLPTMDMSKTKTMTAMCQNSRGLVSVPWIDTGSLTGSIEGAFSGCDSLAALRFNSVATGWSGSRIALLNASMGHRALVEMFESLPVVTGTATNISLTGNPGVAELTAAEKAIATNKGWTLTL